MDIFIDNIDSKCTWRQLRDFLASYLKPLGADVYYCHKHKGKPSAILTLLNVDAAEHFLYRYGVAKGPQRPRYPLIFNNQQMRCRKGLKELDNETLKMLRNAKDYATHQQKAPKSSNASKKPLQHEFQVATLMCGHWDYHDSGLAFVPTYCDTRTGTIVGGRAGFAIVLKGTQPSQESHRIDIRYGNIDNAIKQNTPQPLMSLTLFQAPEITRCPTQEDDLLNLMLHFGITQTRQPTEESRKRVRVSGLSRQHEWVSGTNFVYRLILHDVTALEGVGNLRSRYPRAPTLNRYPTLQSPGQDFPAKMLMLENKLKQLRREDETLFPLIFQLERLARNGYLTPTKVAALAPFLKHMKVEFGVLAIESAIRHVASQLPFAGPHAREDAFNLETLIQSIRQAAAKYERNNPLHSIVKKKKHLDLIYHVKVTPCGLYLEGPEKESRNRVLSQYPEHSQQFLRVTFCDENLQPLHSGHHVSRNTILQERFRSVLCDAIHVAGKIYTFLGFSHSSLRSNQVWFMAPLAYNGIIKHPKDVIKGLGDFRRIQTPAKCAARIGQAFTDITHSIKVPKECIKIIPDIERNGRCFTDGCGTISLELLQKIWQEFSQTGHSHATLLQIRFRGAKGMVSLDPKLKGKQLCLRPSMIKFEGETEELEICGAGHRQRPCYLNQQFIKIFEDLGVNPDAFLTLQKAALDEIREMTASSINAARYLEVNHIASSARVHSLITYMNDLGINYRDDEFLRKVVDMATIMLIRDLKYRARILIPDGLTLHGIADETATLEPNEVYVATVNKEGRRSVLRGEVIITRAPALHPGDIQLVTAVDVPSDSPLQYLHNCVVFSVKGTRDLPSRLSGGDLDGDLYNVIYDRSLWPKRTYAAADYPRVPPFDIGREVTAEDIVDFFLLFMETDRLGQICNAHKQVADQKLDGTVTESCIKLAELASTAVDFSKTGIPAPLDEFPKDYKKSFKPDFMATVPRLLTKGTELKIEEDADAGDLDPVMALDGDDWETVYYESKKTLGRLYRNIDETEFLKALDADVPQTSSSLPGSSVMGKVWDYIQRKALMLDWPRHLQQAREIKDAYEELFSAAANQYANDLRMPLSEVEVFAGVILGKDGGLPSKQIRESNMTMKEDWDDSVRYIRNRITEGNDKRERKTEDANVTGGNDTDYVLERAVACMNVAMEEKSAAVNGIGYIQGFKYVAAALCLQELDRNRTGLRP